MKGSSLFVSVLMTRQFKFFSLEGRNCINDKYHHFCRLATARRCEFPSWKLLPVQWEIKFPYLNAFGENTWKKFQQWWDKIAKVPRLLVSRVRSSEKRFASSSSDKIGIFQALTPAPTFWRTLQRDQKRKREHQKTVKGLGTKGKGMNLFPRPRNCWNWSTRKK